MGDMRKQVWWFRWLWAIYRGLYYNSVVPGASRGRTLNGIRDACWTMLCGYGAREALVIGNIHWQSRLIALLISAIPLRVLYGQAPRKHAWAWRREKVRPRPVRRC
jgi:hypothetical protein